MAGINAITNRTVDFGASDAPLTPDQFAACKGCVQIPWALSATSLAYRVRDLPDHIKLNGAAVAGIYLGKIKKWNDPALKKLNKGKSLPDLAITVIHRSDNSGTTYNLTEYLNSVSRAVEERRRQGRRSQLAGRRRCTGKLAASRQRSSRTTAVSRYVDIACSLRESLQDRGGRSRAGVLRPPA